MLILCFESLQPSNAVHPGKEGLPVTELVPGQLACDGAERVLRDVLDIEGGPIEAPPSQVAPQFALERPTQRPPCSGRPSNCGPNEVVKFHRRESSGSQSFATGRRINGRRINARRNNARKAIGPKTALGTVVWRLENSLLLRYPYNAMPPDSIDDDDDLDEFEGLAFKPYAPFEEGPGDLEALALEIERDPERKREYELDMQIRMRQPSPSSLPDDLRKLFREVSSVEQLRDAGMPEPPYPFDRFEGLDAKIGGMGLVLKARDPKLDRMVAIKLWKNSGAAANAALLAEAQTLAKLSHTNVVTIYEAGNWNTRVYFVMEWIEGQDGHDWMEARFDWYAIGEFAERREDFDNFLDWREVQRIFVAAGNGLAAAHDAGIQHRDFKPANMLIGDDGRVCVADFGVADSLRAAEADGDRREIQAGTPTYMAPERLRGQPGDARADQFSFCVALWKTLHGQRPYAGREAGDLLESIERDAIRGGMMGRDVPQWFKRVIRRGLADDPDQRYPDMHALVQALLDEPPSGDTVDGSGGIALRSGAAGRLLNAPETSGLSGRLEVTLAPDTSALLRDLVNVLSPLGARLKDETVRGQPSGTAAVIAPRPSESAPGPKRQSGSVVVASVMGGIVSGLLVVVMLRPSAPVVEQPRAPVEPTRVVAIEEDPLSQILAHIARDEFSKAEALWIEARPKPSGKHDQGLSDYGSLAVGRACLARAKALINAEHAAAAAAFAMRVATFVIKFGSDSEAMQAGGQLYRDANAHRRRNRPPARSDSR